MKLQLSRSQLDSWCGLTLQMIVKEGSKPFKKMMLTVKWSSVPCHSQMLTVFFLCHLMRQSNLTLKRNPLTRDTHLGMKRNNYSL